MFVLLIPSVSALTSQQFIDKHFTGKKFPVEVAPDYGLWISDAQGNLLGKYHNQQPTIDLRQGDEIVASLYDDVVWYSAGIFDDNFRYVTSKNLSGPGGPAFINLPPGWLEQVGTAIFSTTQTKKMKPQDYHVLFYSHKYDPVSNSYYNSSWKVVSFTLEKAPLILNASVMFNIPIKSLLLGGTPVTVKRITVCGNGVCEPGEDNKNCPADCSKGPAPSKKVANCVTPVDGMVIDTDTVFCQGSYNLSQGLKLKGDGFVLDCNGAEIWGNYSSHIMTEVSVEGDDIQMYNCSFHFVELYSVGDLLNFGLGSSEFYDSDIILTIRHSSIVGNSIFGFLLLYSPSLTFSPVSQNNIADNEIYGLVLNKANENRIYNNIIHYFQLYNSSQNLVYDNGFAPPGGWQEIIYVEYGEENIFENNNVDCQGTSQVIGAFAEDTYKNTFKYNTFENCEVGFNPGWLSKDNLIEHNNFLDNTFSQIQDNTEAKNSYQGNHFSDFKNCADQNSDNICDDPYIIATIPAQYTTTGKKIVVEDPVPSKVKN